MSDYLMRSIQTKSIYHDDKLKFKKDPFDYARNFAVYIPERKSKIKEMIENHEAKIRKKRPFTAKPARAWDIGFDEEGRKHQRDHPRWRGMNQRQQQRGQRNENEDFYQNYQQRRGSQSQSSKSQSSRSSSSYIPSHDGRSDFTNRKQLAWNGKKFGNYKNRPLTGLGNRKSSSKSSKNLSGRRSSQMVNRDLRTWKKKKAFQDMLYYDDRTKQVASHANNPVINDLLRYQDNILKSQELTNGLMDLKSMQLVKNLKPSFKRTKEPRNKGFTYNDYHNKVANAGYSRKDGSGTYFYR